MGANIDARINRLVDTIRNYQCNEIFTSLKRYELNRQGSEVDRPNVILELTDHAAPMAQMTVEEICKDSKKLVCSQLTAMSDYKSDAPLLNFPDFYNIENEAVGQSVHYPENSLPVLIEPLIKTHKDLDRLRLPNLEQAGRIPQAIEIVRNFNEKLGSVCLGCGLVQGPWSMAAGLRGFKDLLYDTKRDIDFVHEILDYCVEVCVVYANALLSNGLDLVIFTDGWASIGECISPENFYRLVVPYTGRVFSRLPKKSAVWLGIWGIRNAPDWRDIIRGEIAAGTSAVFIGDPDCFSIDLAEAKRILVKHDVQLWVGVDAEVIRFGNIKERVSELINVASGGGVTVYANWVTYDCPPERVRCFVESVKSISSH
ncbi:MAG: uroporphyrinogen decarboxylase family protein [Syntrophaceticus sp.]|nr:uroporphyrinogen decarboxylase family protein [Syntrophaceticus sp.]MDD3315000.1 uroporphyrinogen decarboxylase family protein [Syntrophaceticus sp.]MDD4360200.1 uroporphyrinogen decarboxylase family protein [Syntrophaceticus sp.]MDD4783371.1 uroporphyrinogen decarboxylase family protein [Syntrophaceticus sp.]